MIYVYMITGSLQCIDSVSVCSSPVRLRCLCSSLKVEESDGGARGGGGGVPLKHGLSELNYFPVLCLRKEVIDSAASRFLWDVFFSVSYNLEAD